MANAANQKVLVITGNTGTGKTTVARYLNEKYHLPQVVTHTTRPPRAGEIDGRDYYFETEASFPSNHYLEEVVYSHYHYGSSYEGLNRAWEKGPLITIVLDTAGALTYAQQLGEKVEVLYLSVDDQADLTQRLIKRGDQLARIQKRINSAEFVRDLAVPPALQQYAHMVVNNDWIQTKKAIDGIIKNMLK
ncbi:guanylate kinase [Weissella coleopterorum]|uniref:Guanylate kinase n=1 Tax=Weissella coleopterorum TaxID=2714949 RepID=A0A6G8AZA1_9LACO|nr:guanylate kinase [Weissella coleopterorum]QIL50310.1 guanylate kinase [Weissella coleopterorum]